MYRFIHILMKSFDNFTLKRIRINTFAFCFLQVLFRRIELLKPIFFLLCVHLRILLDIWTANYWGCCGGQACTTRDLPVAQGGIGALQLLKLNPVISQTSFKRSWLCSVLLSLSGTRIVSAITVVQNTINRFYV